MNNGILWTDETHSVLRGCDPVSPGCAHCWAAAMAARFSAPGEAFAGLAKRKVLPGSGKALAVWTDKPVMLLPDKLLDILSWRKPKKVFINSVSDTFHADVPFEFIAALWAFMACASHVTFQIVTKRARRMREFFEWTRANGGPDHWLRCALNLCDALEHKDARWKRARETLLVRYKAVTARAELTRGLPDMMALENVWLLVSTENQENYDERVAELLQCPAVVRGISAEPLLGPIDLNLGQWIRPLETRERTHVERLIRPDRFEHLPDIDWVIIGGESGAGCRPNELRWTRDMLHQITEYNLDRADCGHTSPFLKQLGGAALDREAGLVGALYPQPTKAERGWITARLKDGHGGDEAEFPVDLQGYRHFPVPRTPTTTPRSPTGHAPGQLGLLL